ncbi:MAG: HIT domain-containing protein [Deltaproteobacteria bacterium]|nr:HIT domain-containing protein [Deltaproteobacteria bacterium]
MKHIWSPWRMEFIEKARKGHGCIFCGRRSRKHLILHFGKSCFVMMNKYPYNNGHMMIIPYSHKSEISDLTSNEQCEMIRLTGQAVKILKKVLKCAGANCGMNIGRVAGAGIAGHVHMHVVPRWKGDFNFLPVIADVKSMPEYIEDTYKKLKPYFAKI